MAVSLRSLAPNTRVNFTTSMQVRGRSRFDGYTYLGDVSYSAAKNMEDILSLVAASKAYFRAGSPTDMTAITYVLVKQSENSPVVVIPEPLIELNSVEVAGNQVHTVTVRDEITAQRLTEILSGNGLSNFAVETRQV